MIGCQFHQSQTIEVFRLATRQIVLNDGVLGSLNGLEVLTNSVYDYLVDIDHQNKITPRLAKNWTVSDDGLTYKFFLFSDVIFHSGHSLSTGDVIWSFNQLRDLDILSKYENIISIEEEPTNIIVFQLRQPNPFFLFDLADSHAIIIRKGENNIQNLNGTGPYIVKSVDEKQGIVLKRNSVYFGKKSNIKVLKFVFISEEISPMELLINDKVDMIWEVSKSEFHSIGQDERFKRLSSVSNEFDVFWMHSTQGPIANIQVIKALHKEDLRSYL